MSWSMVRRYFTQEIETIRPDLQQWRYAFEVDTNNIPQDVLENHYHIFLGASATDPTDGRVIRDEFAVTVTLFKLGFNDPVNAIDELSDQAFDVRTRLVDPRNQEAFNVAENIHGKILTAVNTGFTPSPITDQNDNTLIFQLTFSVRLQFHNPCLN